MKIINDIMRKAKHVLGNFLRYLYYSYLRASGIEIGKNTMISLGAKIDVRRGKVKIGSNCTITHGTVILSHDYALSLMGNHEASATTTVIEDNVFVGVNSVIISGITLGRNSIVGAGSIVTKSVLPNTVVAGNPAQVIKQLI